MRLDGYFYEKSENSAYHPMLLCPFCESELYVYDPIYNQDEEMVACLHCVSDYWEEISAELREEWKQVHEVLLE